MKYKICKRCGKKYKIDINDGILNTNDLCPYCAFGLIIDNNNKEQEQYEYNNNLNSIDNETKTKCSRF